MCAHKTNQRKWARLSRARIKRRTRASWLTESICVCLFNFRRWLWECACAWQCDVIIPGEKLSAPSNRQQKKIYIFFSLRFFFFGLLNEKDIIECRGRHDESDVNWRRKRQEKRRRKKRWFVYLNASDDNRRQPNLFSSFLVYFSIWIFRASSEPFIWFRTVLKSSKNSIFDGFWFDEDRILLAINLDIVKTTTKTKMDKIKTKSSSDSSQ